MKFMDKLRYRIFRLKVRIFGEGFYTGPEADIGVCDQCAIDTPGSYKTQKKVPIRRIEKTDNIYLCREHYEEGRNNSDLVDLLPFIREAGEKQTWK